MPNNSSNVEKKRKPSVGRPSNVSNFTEEEDIALCKAYVNVSVDPIRGTDMSSATFWAEIKKKFDTVVCNDVLLERSSDSLKNRFCKKILPTTNIINKYWRKIKICPPSGTPTEEGLIELACEEYKIGEGKTFQFAKCLPILHTIAKFNPIVSGGYTVTVCEVCSTVSHTIVKFNPMLAGKKQVEVTGQDGEMKTGELNGFGPPMGAGLPRPIGNKKAKKMAKQVETVDNPNPVLLDLASTHIHRRKVCLQAWRIACSSPWRTVGTFGNNR